VLGISGGVGLRVVGLNPSWSYETAVWLELVGGWPLVAWTIWWVRHKPHRESSMGPVETLFLGGGLAMVAGAGLLLIFLRSSPDGLLSMMSDNIVRVLFDTYASALQTDSCLAEHRFKYLTRPQVSYDIDRAAGNAATDELYRRKPHVNREIYLRALKSYRTKLAAHLLPEPATLYDAVCHSCPGVAAELGEWETDARLSEGTRRLAQVTRAKILEARHATPALSSDDRMLRYPNWHRPP